jgi:hypothetical protein
MVVPPRAPPARKPSSQGFLSSDVTAHLGTPASPGAVSTPSKATARKIAKDLATRCCRSGDSRELAQALLMLIESLD